MTAPFPYTITEAIDQGGSAILFRAVRQADLKPVVLKVLDSRRSRAKDLERLKHEYEIGTLVSSPVVVKPLALETYEGMPALVLEDFGGRSLEGLLGAPMPVERFLPLAILIAAAVADVHQQGIVHKDLKPGNILLNPETGEIKVADLGLASRLPREQLPAQPPRLIEGSLPYLSPEQTGRMNRAIDNRTDLYSLGVTFYQMLTGRLPFEAKDPIEWVHCHIARAPPSPSEIVPEIPVTVARIIQKLLSKMPEDRYQSARGLQHDFERCLEQWNEAKSIEPFTLAEHDVTSLLQFPQKLYGREVEIGLLYETFERVLATGVTELLLVSGYSGAGKSSLVRELDRPIVRERAFFVSGKFEQYKRDIPFATLVQAFRELVLEILAESEARIAAWRRLLLDALGINGQLVVDVVPPIELVIGRQPPVPELPPTEAQNRLRMVFRHFIGVFARREHPLVLFLDDLQWADAASIELLKDLMAHPDIRHLLVIGAYRDNEVNQSHPLMHAVSEVREGGGRVSDIVLGPIRPAHLAAFVAEALRCPVEDAVPLSDLIYEKTAGNPFFSIQFLLSLHEERLIAFDERARVWRWDVAKIRAKNFTDNVVDFMVGKLRRLPAATQRALERLACLGNSAEVAILAMVYGRSTEDVHADLWEAVRAGLVLCLSSSYKFLHDRIEEAAYSLIPEGERAAVHLWIGRLLWSNTAPQEIEDKIFEIVNQLDRGAALITSQEERERLAELNLVAGKRAESSTAYASALKYLAAGAGLLAADRWDRRYELAFTLELHRAECEFLTGDQEAADERLSTLSRRARDLVDRAAVACAQVLLYAAQTRTHRAIEAGLLYLRLIGVDWSPHPTARDVSREYDRMWQTLGSRPIVDLVHLRLMTEPRWRAAMDVLVAMLEPAMWTDENLFCLIVGYMANLSFEHGNSDASCLAYVFLGAVLGPHFGEYRAGFRFGTVGLDLLEKCKLLRFEARVYLVFGYLVNPWARHFRTSREFVRRAFDMAQVTGDISYASYACSCSNMLLLVGGDPLSEAQQEAEKTLAFARNARFGLVVDIITTQIQLIRALRGLLPAFATFDDAQFDEGRFEAHLDGDPGLSIAACWYSIRKLQARFFAGDHAGALEAASKAERLLWTSRSHVEAAEYHFYRALALSAHYDEARRAERSQQMEALVAHHRQIEACAECCPENFTNRAALVAAEIARIEGRDLDAIRLYEEAIRSSRENGFVHNEAIAYETAARFYRMRGFELFADTYLREARERYLRWGADGKVQQLEQQNPHLPPRQPLAPAATLAMRAEQIDVLSVAKASQTISGEIVLDTLIRTLLEVVLAQGGAQRACLILRRGESLSIEAEAALEERGAVTNLLASLPVDDSAHLPPSLVHYVQRTKEHFILSDAAANAGKFAGDDYFARCKPKSVLCMPILRQAEVVGLLYLENKLVAGAFTPDRLTALRLLATQAAISLENALLLAKERAARAEAEDAQRRSAFMAEASALLSQSLDYEEALTHLGRLCAGAFADYCVIDIVEGRQIRRITGAHVDPSKEPLLHELQRRYPPRLDSRHPAATVLRTGKSLLFPELPDDVLQCATEDHEHRQILRALGTHTVLSVPLVARGQMLGALTLASALPGRHFGRADLELAEELASRASIAIDNARLYRSSQEAVRARSEFLTVASHELNTPLTSLTLAVQSLRQVFPSARPVDPHIMARKLDLISRQASRLNRLINDLLDVSRIEAGTLAIELTDVDLGDLVREVVARFEADISQSRCSVTIHVGASIVGHWDRSRLDRVVTNLLSNAIKFGPGKSIEIFLAVEGGMARLAVRDHGIGISPDQHDRIFGRFERAVSERNYGGLGLGLYISRKIVEDLGGSIRCESQLGAGSMFTIELPVSPPSLPQTS